MIKTINMQDMRYLNLFGKITRVSTRFCFKYNEMIMFCVPKPLISKAIGEGGKNIRQISEIIRKRIRIIPYPRGIQDARIFIGAIIKPVLFKDLEIKDNEIIVTAGNQNKAALIGRNKRRFLEMQKIIKDFFGKEFRIV
jgi:transcription antitermination factor NusA-like protein